MFLICQVCNFKIFNFYFNILYIHIQFKGKCSERPPFIPPFPNFEMGGQRGAGMGEDRVGMGDRGAKTLRAHQIPNTNFFWCKRR
ncbi:MAG: hypothetical protein COS63_01895 [Anaerolineae bacterium CG06_land_8_20_14_3_00_57_67]|nr:MAG: hypothetical protein COS63_01895 [Anaerolineae bacterium CG06_land_8_20_14_3_00_57_67]